MTAKWVVSYRVEYGGGMSIFEAYRGTKKECQRIANHSVAPNTFEGQKITAFETIIGPAKEWDQFLEENG
jgi:hypothetical protein